MTNTLANPGPFDPLAHMEPDEPVFPLAGHDPDAPATIAFWSDTRRKRLMSQLYDNPTPARQAEIEQELRQCTEADMIAADMIRWRKGWPAHAEIIPKPTYSGNVRQDVRRDAEIKVQVQNLREAAYHAQLALDGLTDLSPLLYAQLTEAIRLVNGVADHVAVQA